MTCPSCSRPVPDGSRFCPHCAAPADAASLDYTRTSARFRALGRPLFGGDLLGDAAERR